MGGQPPVLQGGIRKAIGSPDFHILPQEDKLPVMESIDPGFAQLPEDDKIGIVERLSPAMQPKNQGNMLDAIPGAMAGLADTASYITQPFEKLLNTGVDRYNVSKEAAYQYNPSFQAGANAGKFIGDMAGYGLSALGGLPGITAYSANKNIQQVAGGEQNIGQAVFNTALDPLMAKFVPQSRGMLGAIGKNAAVGGAGGAASYAGNTALTGQQFDPRALFQSVLEGGATGGALGGGAHIGRGGPVFAPKQVAAQPNRPMVPMRNVNQALEQGQQIGEVRQLKAAITKRQEAINQAQSITEQKTLQDRLNKFNQLYKQLDDVERSADPIVSKRAAAMKQQVQKEFQRVQAEKETKFPSKKPAKQVKTLKPEQLPTAINLGVKAVKTGGAQRARFKQIVKGYSQQDQFKINKGIEDAFKSEKAKSQTEATRAAIRREAGKEKAKEIATERKTAEAEKIAAAKARIKEAEKVANAKPKADPERKKLEKAIEDAKNRVARQEQKQADATRKKEMDALKADIIKRNTTEKQAKETQAKATERGEAPAQSQQGMSQYLAKAKKQGKVALVEYEAEITGERESSTFRYKNDTVVSSPYTDAKGNLVYKVINENGQLTTRHIHDETSGSRTMSVTLTDTPAPYKLGENGEVIEVSSGRVVEQNKGETAYKSSEVRAGIEQIENFDRTLRKYKEKKARVGDIVKASRDLDDVSLEKQLNEKNPDVTKDISGEPC